MNYKEILKKYIQTVSHFEGRDYIPKRSDEYDEWDKSEGIDKHQNLFGFTDEEIKELRNLSNEKL